MKGQKGITLIALILIIIILIVLVGVTIAAFTGNNGFFASQATKEINAEKEAKILSNLAYLKVKTEVTAKTIADETYSPVDEISSLVSLCEETLESEWVVTASVTETGERTANITLKYTGDELNNSTHTLTYNITITEQTDSTTEEVETEEVVSEEVTDDTTNVVTISGPVEGYNKISTN